MANLDTIVAACECGITHEWKSNSGPGRGRSCTLENAPWRVLIGANRDGPLHCDCGNWLKLDPSLRRVEIVKAPDPNGPFIIRICDGKVLDFQRLRAEGDDEWKPYFGKMAFGQFDRAYVGL